MNWTATIYYICYLPPKTGGELVNVQTVATLNQLGVRAVALVNLDASLADLPPDYTLPVEPLAVGRRFCSDDIVVIPEFYRAAFQHFASQPCRCVVHNQGPFLTFQGFQSMQEMNAAGLEAGIACSRFCRQMMQNMGSNLTWQVVTPFVHPLFHDRGVSKKLQVAYMPNKRPREAPVIHALFRKMYPAFAHVPWKGIAGVSRWTCAEIMAESAVFATLSCLEGLGLPPLEAMSSGTLVCGFTGHGGTEYARPDNGLWVDEGDHEGFVHAVAAALQRFQTGGPEAEQQRTRGRQTAALFSQRRFEQELLDAWQAILGNRWPNYLLAKVPGDSR